MGGLETRQREQPLEVVRYPPIRASDLLLLFGEFHVVLIAYPLGICNRLTELTGAAVDSRGRSQVADRTVVAEATLEEAWARIDFRWSFLQPHKLLASCKVLVGKLGIERD